MTHLQLNLDLLPTLKDKVVVLTGGATGIGRAAVEQFHDAGAHVVFGDVSDDPAQEVVQKMKSTSDSASQKPPGVHFQHCDTSNYAEQLALFALAMQLYEHVDIVIANAGMAVHKDIFSPTYSIPIETEPSTKEIDVNLKGVMFTARIGLHYLRQNSEGGDLVLTSSIAGFKESGGLASYAASKHGVIGLMRGLRPTAGKEGVRVNVISPWMTKTRLVKGIEAGWYARGLPTNEPADVSRAMLICATANRAPSSSPTHPGATLPFAGKILFVTGGESYEIEDRLWALEPQWLGEENSRELKKGQAYLASDETSWDAERGEKGG